MSDLIGELAKQAKQVVAIGSCAAFGGFSSSGRNPAGAVGLQYSNQKKGGLLGKDFTAQAGEPVINISGCAPHPGWMADALTMILQGSIELDEYARPRFYTDTLAHHGCPRNEFYEYKASAPTQMDQGCFMENLGCKATQARADCNIRLWPGGGSCLRGAYACINCTAPGFQRLDHSFLETPKIAGIPINLPIDMPKAWYVALATLAKAATPSRVKQNASAKKIEFLATTQEQRKDEQ